NAWPRFPSTGPSTPWWPSASCTASKAATPFLPAMPATPRAGSWCSPVRPADRWRKSTAMASSKRSTRPPTRRPLAPKRPWWKFGAYAPIVRGRRRSRIMDGRERQPQTGPPSAGQHSPADRQVLNGEAAGAAHGNGRLGEPRREDELISARGIMLSRGGRTLLQDVDIDVAPAEIVTLIGPNGAGKTTLVRVLLGILLPNRGEVKRKAGLGVGYVPQRL